MFDPSEVQSKEEWVVIPKHSSEPISLLTGGITPPRTNYVQIRKEGVAVEGQFVIDPSMPPIPSLVPSLASSRASEPKNLNLYTSKGPIIAEIWVIYDVSGESKRISMDMRSDNGSVHAKVYDPSFLFGVRRTRPTFDLRLCAEKGDISVSLPRCFHGPINILTHHEHIAFSPVLKEGSVLLSDISGNRTYFVGDQPHAWKPLGSKRDERGVVEEQLDKLFITGRHTKVQISFVDEEVMPGMWEAFWKGTGRFLTLSS